VTLLVLLACSDSKSPSDTVPAADDTDVPAPDDTAIDPDPDGDGDGWPASEDCDDDNANAWPGAHEVWYDGEDWDCAGDDDYDADADGHRHEDYEGDDCDDQDPEVNPSAADPACDGLDQDCDGGDDDDQDGDGEATEACDGGDCDDEDAWIGPHMAESCDEVDRNCDGETLEEGVCGDPQDALALASLTVVGDVDGSEGAFEYFTVFSGDLDLNGHDELYTHCAWCETSDGSMGWQYYLFEGPLEGRDIPHTEVTQVAVEDGGWEQDELQYPDGGVGDFDGDGLSDLVVAAGCNMWSSGAVYLATGPASDWGTRLSLSDSAAFQWFSQEGVTGLGARVAATGDLDADGLDDFAIQGGVEGSTAVDYNLWVFLGRGTTGASTELVVGDEVAIDLPGTTTSYASTDLDGDGFVDLFVRGEDLWIVSGPDLATGDGAGINDLAWQTWTDPPDCLAVLGDWNGDGYPDWLGGDDDADDWADEGGVLHFVAGSGDTESMSLSQDATGHAYGYAEQELGGMCLPADLDGTGEDEAVVLGRSTDSDTTFAHFVVRSDLGLPEGTASFEGDLEYVLSADYTLYGRELASGDWNGDGFEDLVVPNYQWSQVDGPGGFAILPGWDIPWDDPEYW